MKPEQGVSEAVGNASVVAREDTPVIKARRVRRRRASGAVGLFLAAVLTLSACGGSDSGDGGSDAGAAAKEKSDAVVSVTPKNKADNAKTDALAVRVKKGKLTSVQVKDTKGHKVDGSITSHGKAWKPKQNLAAGTEYKVHAVAKDDEGQQAAKDTSFTTETPKDTFVGNFTPEDGSKVGVGMPVSIKFNKPVSDDRKAEVEKHLQVNASPKANVVGHWFDNQRLDFRPKDYWKAGTKITLSLRLRGVQASDGVYGKQNKDVTFTVGRNQVSVVDIKSKKMKVTQDGKTVKTIPISGGSPDHPTYNGKMVISEKHQVTRMDGETVGFGGEYDIKDVPHAMRLSTSGTFIHGNYWSGGAFGNANTSHGCVGLRDAKGGNSSSPGGWFYSHSLIGDVVQVKNSPDKKIKADNGLNGWNMDWDTWVQGSALHS